jgi:threonine/homoserine/homoserine lactone efflux protein
VPVSIDNLLLFLPGSILVTVLPGADMALVMRQVLVAGTALAQRTIYGNLTGLVVHAVALALGLSVLLATSAEAYNLLKLVDAGYVIFLGVQTLRSARRGEYASDDATVRARAVPSKRKAFGQGFISTVLNPKPAILFYSYVPLFVDQRQPIVPQIAFLTAVHILIGLVWMTLWAHMVHRAHRTLTRRDVRRWLEGATGAVLILLGLRIAIEQRH